MGKEKKEKMKETVKTSFQRVQYVCLTHCYMSTAPGTYNRYSNVSKKKISGMKEVRRLKYGQKDRRRRKSGDGDFKVWSTAPSASRRSNRVIRASAPTGFSMGVLTKAASVAYLDQEQDYEKISTNKHYLNSQRKQKLSETQKTSGKICL